MLKYRVEYGTDTVVTVVETDWIHYAATMKDFVQNMVGKTNVRIIETANGAVVKPLP